MKAVKLSYYDEFRCIGSECGDSCCKHWRICLSKKEYLYYKNLDCSPELRSVIDSAFKINGENEINYAEMKLKGGVDCPFLDSDSLCMLQKELGEDALSYTCSVFPRLHAKIGEGTVRWSCSAACRHVTELLTKHPEGLKIVEEEYKGGDRHIDGGRYSSPSITKQWKGFPFYWSILRAQIDILQDRAFSVPDRMLILGYFCQKAEEYVTQNVPYKIPALANMLKDRELCERIAVSLKPPQSDMGAAIRSMDILLKMNSRIQTADSGLPRLLFARVMTRLDCAIKSQNGKTSADFSITEYKKLCGVFRRIEAERTYIIENLLVNLVFASDPQQGIWINYFTLAVFYNTLKICAPVFLPKSYDDASLAAALTYAVKMVLNTRLAEKGTAADFTEKHTFTLPYAAFLVG
ncbi:MAG: flagellin lysine-N-methylase [Bacteroides sp.]|nr:flagellin lysine-N-methylase [Bacteroides sp.]